MATTIKQLDGTLAAVESFVPRHIGPSASDIDQMVEAVGFGTLDELIEATIPANIRYREELGIPHGK
ncbi:MAG: hypothetical protein ACSLFK_10100, partial [Gemmatimonadaceae bacterium]